MSTLDELTELLAARFAIHPLAGVSSSTLELIRTGLKLGSAVQVARIAARALSAAGVAEALVAAITAAGDDPVALAEVRHVAQAAAPLAAVGLHNISVRADSFGFNSPHAEWLLSGHAEYQEILEAWAPSAPGTSPYCATRPSR